MWKGFDNDNDSNISDNNNDNISDNGNAGDSVIIEFMDKGERNILSDRDNSNSSEKFCVTN